MHSLKIWVQLMLILALIVAAVILGVILVPVLTVIGVVWLAYLTPKITKDIKESEDSRKKPSDYFKDL